MICSGALAVLARNPPRALRLRTKEGVGCRQRVHQATQRGVQDVTAAAVIDGNVAAWAACIDADGQALAAHAVAARLQLAREGEQLLARRAREAAVVGTGGCHLCAGTR